jgi:hypothetical protein
MAGDRSATDMGHLMVDQHDVRQRRVSQRVERLLATGGGDHRVAVDGEQKGDEFERDAVIVCQQHA